MMISGSMTIVFGFSALESLAYNIIPLLLFCLACYYADSKVQLAFAKLLTLFYSMIMLAVYVGLIIQIAGEGETSLTCYFPSKLTNQSSHQTPKLSLSYNFFFKKYFSTLEEVLASTLIFQDGCHPQHSPPCHSSSPCSWLASSTLKSSTACSTCWSTLSPSPACTSSSSSTLSSTSGTPAGEPEKSR